MAGAPSAPIIAYYRIPDLHDCAPVDRERVKAEMESQVGDLARLTEWIAVERAPRALLEKRAAPS